MAGVDHSAKAAAPVLQALGGNRLLSTCPEELRARLAAHASLVELTLGQGVLRRGIDVDSSLFPIGGTTISMLVDLSDRRSIEVASIGNEGAVGGIVSCGHAPAFSRAEVIVAGSALRIPLHVIEEAKGASAHLRNLFCRYSDFLLAQVMQSVACNAYHPIEARAARWLATAMDRAGPRLSLTQDALAGLLGVQRTTVNAVSRLFQDKGLISTGRGKIEVLDRAAIVAQACECHDRVEKFFADVIGPDGRGTTP